MSKRLLAFLQARLHFAASRLMKSQRQLLFLLLLRLFSSLLCQFDGENAYDSEFFQSATQVIKLEVSACEAAEVSFVLLRQLRFSHRFPNRLVDVLAVDSVGEL